VTRRLGNWRTYRDVTHTCLMYQRATHTLSRARAPQPPAFNAVVGLASCRRLESTGHMTVLVQWPLPQGRVAAPDLLPGGMGGPGPLAGPDAQTPWGSGFHTRGFKTIPWWSGPVVAIPEHSPLRARRDAGSVRAWGEVRRPYPQLSAPGHTPYRPEV
jgi:hypothetical protein